MTRSTGTGPVGALGFSFFSSATRCCTSLIKTLFVGPRFEAVEPYAADNSTASNLGPTNSALIQTVQKRVAELKKENPNAPPGPVPVDLVTSSGSGLDPDITVAGALYQVPRIAQARGLSESVVHQLVMDHVTGRFLGIFGEPFVNVLDLNLALDALK